MSRLHSHSNEQPVPLDGPALVRADHALMPRSRRLTVVSLLAALGLLSGCSDTWPFSLIFGDPGPAVEQTGKAPADERAEWSDPMISEAQTLLAKLGYGPGQADGIEGPRTREAVRNYQVDTGREVDGRVTRDLLAHLKTGLRRGGEAAAKPRLKAKSPPRYELGNTFVYSDGRVETIVGVSGDKIRWQSNRGTIFTTYRDFVLPLASWVSAGERGQTILGAQRETLWPLEPGKKNSFSVRTIVQISDRPDNISDTVEQWHCQVEQVEKISVVAGTFDTLKVVCRRSARESLPQLTRVWYYAPRVGHYVRMNDFYEAEEQDRHVELVAIQPGGNDWPPAARAGLGWALQHALESMSSEEQIEWSSSAIETRVTIKPYARFERGDGKTCRNFVQIWVGKRIRHNYPGTACRGAEGRWQVPGLPDDGPEKARALLGGRS
jgi:hypothetical protein